MMRGARLSSAAIDLLSKCRNFGNSGFWNSPGISRSGKCGVGKGTGKPGAGYECVMDHTRAREVVYGLSPGMGQSPRNLNGNGIGMDKYGASSWRFIKLKALDVDVWHIWPVTGPSSRNISGKETGLREGPGGRPTKPNAEEVDGGISKVVDYLNSLRNFEKEGIPKGAGTESDAGFDLQRMSRLLLRLGNPLSQYPVVHVAGTKGKGSTVAFLSSILRAAGFRVGAYTSPHIRSLRERIVSGTTGQPISTRAFNELFDDVHETVQEALAAEAGTLTHFEVLTALAFVHFAREKVDVAVIEAGLGGARDATNVIQAAGLLAAVIVGIGEEHLDALGGSLESVALAKAGIIKDSRPVIMGKQTEKLAEIVIRKVAASKKAPVLPRPGHPAIYNMKGIYADTFNHHQLCDISINRAALGNSGGAKDEVWAMEDLKIPTLGAHQLDNAATAMQTALCLRGEGWEISDSAIRKGLESTTIPGRFQFAAPVEAIKLGCHGSTVIFDGAHTKGSAAALACTLRETFPTECLAMVVAMASEKDHEGFARAILDGTTPDVIVTSRVKIAGSYERSLSSRSLADSFKLAGQDLNIRVVNGLQNDLGSRSGMEGLSSSEPECTSGSISGGSKISDSSGSTLIRSQRRKQLVLVETDSILRGIAKAAELVQELNGIRQGVICITGSLHAVSAAMSLLSIPNSSF